MPVRKFRSVEEMEPIWYQPGDPALEEAFAVIWALAQQTVRLSFPPGVYKHRSIEDLNQQTESWSLRNFQDFQARQAQERAHVAGGTMPKDPKTWLKELSDKGFPSVQYTTERQGGPDHEPGFVSVASLPDGRTAKGVGRSKVEAEQHAAQTLVHTFRIKGPKE